MRLAFNLPLARIKIDQGFVRSLRPDDSRRTIIGLIVALCREPDLTCVVEGVETDEQLEMLRQLDCEQMQGYLFSRPVRAEHAAALLTAARPLAPFASGRIARVPDAGVVEHDPRVASIRSGSSPLPAPARGLPSPGTGRLAPGVARAG